MAWNSTSIGYFTTEFEYLSAGNGGTFLAVQSGSKTLNTTSPLTLDDIFSPSVVVSASRTHYDTLVLDGVTLYGGELSNAAIVSDTVASASLSAAISGGLWAVSSINYFSSSTDYNVYYPFVNRNTGVTSSIAKVTGFSFPGSGIVNLLFENNNVTFQQSSTLASTYGASYASEMEGPERLVYLVGDTSSLNPNELGYPLSASLSSGVFSYSSPVLAGGGGGISRTSGVGSTGYGYVFGGQSQSILIRHNSNFDILNSYDNWSVSFWSSLPSYQPGSNSEQLIVSKQVAESYPNSYGNIVTRNNQAAAYPFKIGVYTDNSVDDGKIFFETSDGKKTTRITSSAAYNDGSYRQYTFNKTGSLYEIWVDGTRISSQSVSYTNINNQHDILIGNNTYGGGNAFSGSIDEFRIRRTSLSSNEIESLSDTNVVSGSFLQKNYAGYVFYKQGMIVVTDPRPRYQNMFLGNGNWDYTNKSFQLDYRATKVVEEVSILCELGKGEFNVSSNPSLRLTSNDNDPRLKSMITGSDFRPYVTQVGLYNDSGDLLAIAKLGSPLKKRQDVDVTINVKFDID